MKLSSLSLVAFVVMTLLTVGCTPSPESTASRPRNRISRLAKEAETEVVKEEPSDSEDEPPTAQAGRTTTTAPRGGRAATTAPRAGRAATTLPRSRFGIARGGTTAPLERNSRSFVNRGTSRVAEARQQLMDIAKRVEGEFVEVVADIVDAVESGDQPWSIADQRMHEARPGKHRFARETIAAYEKWKAVRIAAEK